MKSLGGFFYRQACFGGGSVCLGFAAGEDFEFAEGAQDKLDDVAGAALIVVVGAGADATEKANPGALLDHRLDAGDKGGGKDGDAVPVGTVLLRAVFGLPALGGGNAEGCEFAGLAESLDLNLADVSDDFEIGLIHDGISVWSEAVPSVGVPVRGSRWRRGVTASGTRRGEETDLVAHKGLARAGAKRQLGPLNSKNGGTRRRRQFSSHVNASPETGNKGQTGKSDHSKEIKDQLGAGQCDNYRRLREGMLRSRL